MQIPRRKGALITIIILIFVLFWAGVIFSGLSHTEGKEKKSLWDNIYSHHFRDDPRQSADIVISLPKIKLGNTIIDMSITKHILTMLIIAFVICLLFILSARYYKRGALNRPNRAIILVEILFTFVRDDIVGPSLGDKTKKFLPFFTTLFLFLVFANLWSNVPFLGTAATANFAVTTTLMLVCFIMAIAYGMKQHGIFKYWLSIVPSGVPGWLIWFMWIMELVALFVRYIALTIRLFANMVGGHVALFVIIALPLAIFENHFIYFLAGPVALAVSMLELFVAVLQAYIFVLLASIFLGMSGSHEH